MCTFKQCLQSVPRVLLAIAILVGASGKSAHADLLVISNPNSPPEVLRYDQGTGAFLGAFVAPGSGGLEYPGGLAFGPDGNLYVPDYFNRNVLRYNGTTGAFIDTFVPTGSGGLGSPGGLTFGPDGNLYVGAGSVYRYNGTTGVFIDVFTKGEPPGAGQLTFGPDGNLFVPGGGGTIRRYNGTTGDPLPAPGQSDGIFVPAWTGAPVNTNLTFGPAGDLFVTNDISNDVLRYNGINGNLIGTFVPSGSGGLNDAHGMAFGPDGNLYIANYGQPGSLAGSVLRFDRSTGDFIDIFVYPGSGGLIRSPSLIFTPPELINELVTFVPITSTYQTTSDATGCPAGFVGRFSFDARLTNKNSSPPISDLVAKVKTLTNGNLLHNADQGNGGVGSTLTVLEEDGYSDGILSPGEFLDVNFNICLKEKKPFTFFVDVLGGVEDNE